MIGVDDIIPRAIQGLNYSPSLKRILDLISDIPIVCTGRAQGSQNIPWLKKLN